MEGASPIKIRPGLFALDLKPMGIKYFLSTYVLKGREVAIVDCGPSCSIETLIKGLEALGVSPKSLRFVIATHIHIDHVGGASELLKWASDAELLVHEKGVKHMADPGKLWESTRAVLGELADAYGPIRAVDADRIVGLRDGDEVEIAGWSVLQVLETPGHASHHLSFFEPEERIIFPGDSAGIYIAQLDVLLPTTPPPHRLDLALGSLDKQIELGPRTACYPHFGSTDEAVSKLSEHKRQLELWAEVIRDRLAEPEERILDFLVEQDPNLARISDIMRAYPMLREGLLRSIKGIKGFFSRGARGHQRAVQR